MNGGSLSNPAASLLAFGDALGINQAVWAEREELEQLIYSDEGFSRDAAAGLTMNQIDPLLSNYGDALTCRFLLGDRVVLQIAPGLDESALEEFRRVTRHTPAVIFELLLDKTHLLGRWLGKFPACRPFLYLFPEALEQFLGNQLGDLEKPLWGTDPGCKIILLVPRREIWLDGPFLAVVGGKGIEEYHTVVPSAPPDASRVQAMYQACRDNLKWQESWLNHLTPLHLKLDGASQPGDRIASALQVHLVNSIVLYSADRTVGSDGNWRATYAGAKKSVGLTLGDPQTPLPEGTPSSVQNLLRTLEWAYDPRWTTDRLSMVQSAVADALHAAEPPVRYRLLLHNAANIYDGLQWHWKAFIEDKVDAYMAQVRALEDYVASTVQAFADQISAMIKSLSDTVLAAVGALLGSFIAAFFKDKFNPTVFRIGMLVYAFYVLAFPLGLNMLNQRARFRAMIEGLEIRQSRFEARLYRDKVKEIVGTQIDDSQARFLRWFRWTLVVYGIVIILAVIAALVVPGVMADQAAPPTPMPSTATSVP
jgi:hypothetical protein